MTASIIHTSASGQAGWMAELSPAAHRPIWQRKSKRFNQNTRDQRNRDYTQSEHPGASACFGGNFPMSVVARKSITAWSHFSNENRLVICTCRHLPPFHSVAIPMAHPSAFCWSFKWLQWRKRCSRVCTVPPQHHPHLLSSRCLNRFRYVPVSAFPLFSL